MKTDKAIHEVYNYFEGKEIRWHDFSEVGLDEPYSRYYYAEECLYVIQDVMIGSLWFCEASSPAMALATYKFRLDEAMKAGAYVDEEEWE